MRFTKRRYAFGLFDRPDCTVGVLQLTERDLEQMIKCDRDSGGVARLGAAWYVSRPASRQPMAVEFSGFSSKLLALPMERLKVDLLRIHGVEATERDLADGGALPLVCSMATELLGGRRAMA
jgi:hypothetical protein